MHAPNALLSAPPARDYSPSPWQEDFNSKGVRQTVYAAADVRMGPLPDILDLEQLERDSLFTCRDMDGKVYPRHLNFEPTVYTETEDSNGPVIGNMCPRCGYWAGSLALAKEGIVVHRWPE